MKKAFFCKGLLLALLFLCQNSLLAADFEYNGINYNVLSYDDLTAEVTYSDEAYNTHTSYSGEIVIPQEVTYEGNTYTVTSIGDYAFYYGTAINSIELPTSITSIGSYAFYYCNVITSIDIDNVTTIDDNAFYSCFRLTDISISESVVSIGSYAFYNCGISEAYLPNLTVIEDYTFCKSSLLTFIAGDKLTSIGSRAFSESSLTDVTIGNNVTYIGDYAFYSCKSLENLSLGEKVDTIYNYAFYQCSKLEQVIIPNSVTFLGMYAFGSSGLTSIIVPGGVDDMFYAFYSCKSLETVTICEGIETLGRSAVFDACSSLKTVNLPKSVSSIGENVFSNCTSLEAITILNPEPPSCSSNTFNKVTTSDCKLYVPSGYSNIYSQANIWNEFDIEELDEDETFEYDNLTYVIVSKDEKTAKLTYPRGSTSYSGEIVIPSQVEYNSETYSIVGIGEYSFNNNVNITSVTIPESVTSIELYAFGSCNGLTSLTCLNPTPASLELYAFGNINTNNVTLFVPMANKDIYSQTDVWKDFNIIGIYGQTEYSELIEKIEDEKTTLTSLWEDIEQEAVKDNFEDEYTHIIESLTSLESKAQELYSLSNLNEETAKDIETELDEISASIKEFSNEIDQYKLYLELKDSLNSVSTLLESTWTTLEETYPNIIEELEADYKAIEDELSTLSEEIDKAYNNGLDDEKVEAIESSLEEISLEIEALSSKAEKANTTYLYNKVLDEINVVKDSLEATWAILEEQYPNIIEELEPDYSAIEDELSTLGEELADAYTSGELDDEKIEDFENSLEEISLEIENLTSKAQKANATYLYNKVLDEINVVKDSLEATWATLEEQYPNVTEGLESNYKAIEDELSTLGEELAEVYTSEELDEEKVEAFESSLEEISSKIDELVSQVKKSDTNYYYNLVVDEIKQKQEYLDDTWNTIQINYSSVASEFEGDYKIILTELNALSQEIQDIYSEDHLNRELIETIESRLEPISSQIENLLSQAEKADLNYYYNMVMEEIKSLGEYLDDTWNTILKDYSDVASDFEGDYKVILTELNALNQEMEDTYSEDNLHRELIGTIESRLETIYQEIQNLLSQAEQAHTTGIGIRTMDYGDDVQIFNLNGNKVQNPQKGQIYIFRYADGQTKKVFVK